MAQKNALEIPANLLLAPHFWALLEPSKKGLADSRFALKSGHRGPRHLLPEDYHRPPRNASWFLDRPRQGDGARRPLSAAMDAGAQSPPWYVGLSGGLQNPEQTMPGAQHTAEPSRSTPAHTVWSVSRGGTGEGYVGRGGWMMTLEGGRLGALCPPGEASWPAGCSQLLCGPCWKGQSGRDISRDRGGPLIGKAGVPQGT